MFACCFSLFITMVGQLFAWAGRGRDSHALAWTGPAKNNSKFTDIDVMSRSENNTKLDIISFFNLNLTMMKVVNVVFFS